MKYVALILLCSSYIIGAQDIQLELLSTGLNSPVNIKHAGDDRLFIAERAGYIEILNTNGSLNPSPFLDINTRVTNNGGEQGLLGIAFHPDYVSNGYFYVNYIDNSENTVISRFSRSTVNTADPTSELILLTISQPFSNHNGGDMAFGADGYLYISTGDGGSGGDPQDNAQDLTTFLGKILRIDVDNTDPGKNYAIPNDNPFVSNGTALNEIWAFGLRNPWKFSFDRTTNDLWIADVGQMTYEEINMATPSVSSLGLNYGWRCYEGNSTYNTSGCANPSTMTFPIAEYSHSGSGVFKCSITGGYRHRGITQASLNGLYFFADYCSDEIGVLEQSGMNWTMSFTQQYNGNGWSCFGEDINGELYVAGVDSGNVFKIIDANLSTENYELSKIKMYPNPTKNELTFDLLDTYSRIQSINIYSIQGKLLKSITNFTNPLFTIFVDKMSSGLYLIEIKDKSEVKETRKLILN